MENDKLSRREFMALSAGALVQIGLPGVFVKLSHAENAHLASELRPDGRLRIPPGQMAVESIHKMGGMSGPGLNPEWRLQIKGEVKKHTSFSWNDLMQFPQTDLLCDVHCVTGWTLLDSRWQGIRLRHLMDAVGVTEKAAFIIFEAHAGYTTIIPVREARKDNVILAHTFSGERLAEPHGAPLRGLVPDRYFYKSAKWIEGINFSANDKLGYWESGGFSNSADPWKEDRYK
ncbi:MAG: molybdopterin-dependent oxidoreductase [Desulfatirhabdiaceae bacterium]|nr:molybdopterin-dependent oxidoreductase [Desulfatirhabdiaceae bacterium]